MKVEVGDIVQSTPDSGWDAALVVVTEVKPWGIQGYTRIPRGGEAYIRLTFDKIEQTGGKAVFVPAGGLEGAE